MKGQTLPAFVTCTFSYFYVGYPVCLVVLTSFKIFKFLSNKSFSLADQAPEGSWGCGKEHFFARLYPSLRKFNKPRARSYAMDLRVSGTALMKSRISRGGYVMK
jgi:hypothetical protein